MRSPTLLLLTAALSLLTGGWARAQAPARTTQSIEGWTLSISPALLEKEPELTAKAVELLRGQLTQINKVVPAAAVEFLHTVPLWFNPAYGQGQQPRAEFHPDAGWLTAHQRDPIMAHGVEFTNIAIFEHECRRMPMLALHELSHAYHFLVLGDKAPEIVAAYEKAKASGVYAQVDRWTGDKIVRDRAYALTNPMEYFAETSEAFFGRNDFQPFERAELQIMDPTMAAVLERVWKK